MKHREMPVLVEFKGEVSPENRRWLVRRVARRAALLMLCVLFPLMIIASLILIWEIGWEYGWAIALFLGIGLLIPLLTYFLYFTKREQKTMFPTRVVFYGDRDDSVLFDIPKRRLEMYREDIKGVMDKGAYYYLDIPLQEGRGIVCQKNLMTQGTVETFENLFKGKILRNPEK